MPDDAFVIIGIGKYAFFLETEGECHFEVRSQGTGHLAGDGIGIGIEEMPLPVVGKGSHYGHESVVYQSGKHLPIHLVHISHEAEIHHLCASIVQLHLFGCTLVAEHEVHVRSCKSYGIDASLLQGYHYVLVHQSAIYHGHHLQHILVCHTSASYHVAFDAQRGGYACGRASPSVYQNLGSGDVGKPVEQL